MANFKAAYDLHSRCSIELVYVGNTYTPRWMDAAGDLRYDAHVYTTWKMAKAVCIAYGEVDSEVIG